MLKQSRQHVDPKDARVEVYLVGGGLPDGVHYYTPARGAYLPKVTWASVETDKHFTLVFKHAICTTVKLKKEKNGFSSYCFNLRSSISNEKHHTHF